ncbi:MAG: TIGR04086 family membrane protein [Oscillibacter sp.]|nr:TIGR04086 family membrane protein [Oscillibacter sp.]
MGKDRRKQAVWVVFLRGELIALGIYLLGIMLLTLLVVKGVLPERGAYPAVAVMCLLTSMTAGLLAVRKSSLGRLSAGILSAVIFGAILLLVGTCAWQEIAWTGRGGVLLLCALCGGILSVMMGGQKRRKGKRVYKKAL